MPEFKLAGGLAAVVAVALGTSSAMAQREAAFTIRSSLDGKTTLPHRIAWIAYPSAAVEAPGVEFLIDGKVVFRNRLEPYAFGADGRDETQQKKVRTGYLVTSWLSPGSHRFTVRAQRASTAGGRVIATKTVVARVLRSPAPPAALAGTWRRSVPRPVPGDPGALYSSGRGGSSPRDPAPAGPWTMIVDRRYVQHAAPTGYSINSDYVAGPQTIRFAGPVWTIPRIPLAPSSGHNANPAEWGWCDPWGRETTYNWSVEGETLTLEPTGGTDACKQRGTIFTGEWTR
jgi:hypothetical protein